MTRPNELRADVRLTGDEKAKRGLKDVGDAADRAGDKLHEMGEDAGFLTKEIAKAETQYKQLIQTLDQTGDEALLKQIRAERRRMRQLEQLKKELTGAAADAASGGTDLIGEGLAKGIGAAIAKGGPALYGSLAVVAAGLVPFLGGIISTAVIGGVGIGGIAGGIALAAKDQRVKDAATELGEVASTAFGRAAEPFVAPTIEALDHLGRAARDIASTLEPAFESLAPVVMPLTRGLTGLAEEALPGIVKGFEAAKPVIRAIGAELPEIGRALGDFVGIISEDADGAVLAFAQLSDIIQGVLRYSGVVISTLSKVYEFGTRAAAATSNFLADFTQYIPILNDIMAGNADKWQAQLDLLNKSGSSAEDFVGDLNAIGDAASDAAAEIDALKTAMDAAFGVVMGLDQAMISYEKSFDEMVKTLREGTRTLDINTEAGRENMQSILAQISDIKRLRDASIEQTGQVAEANALYEHQLNLIEQTAIAMGFQAGQVHALVEAYRQLPEKVDLEIRVKGLKGILEQISTLARLLGSNAAAGASLEGSYVSGRASGGPVMAGATYVVGENGPEILQMGASGGYVHNASQTAAMMSGASGGSRLTFNPAPPPSDGTFWLELVRMAWPYILQQVRVDGGDLTAFGAA